MVLVTMQEYLENPRLFPTISDSERCSRPGCTRKAGSNYTIDNKPVCSDCYFEGLDNLSAGHGCSHGGCVAGDD
jgi:hypothetical protein